MSIFIHRVALLTVFTRNLENIRDCAYIYTYRTCQQIIPADFQILYSDSGFLFRLEPVVQGHDALL
jgi:hypothetical protein